MKEISCTCIPKIWKATQRTNSFIKIVGFHPHGLLFEAIVEELSSRLVRVRRPDANVASSLLLAFGLLALLLETKVNENAFKSTQHEVNRELRG